MKGSDHGMTMTFSTQMIIVFLKKKMKKINSKMGSGLLVPSKFPSNCGKSIVWNVNGELKDVTEPKTIYWNNKSMTHVLTVY